MRSTPLSRALHRGVCLVAAAGMLTGCAQGFTQAQRIGTDDGTDSCRRELVALDSTGNFFGEDILKGAVIGAIGGAALGAIAGGGRGAAIGALAGAAAGSAGGYLAAVQQQARDQAAVSAQVVSDLQREGAQIDRTQIAFDQLMECRFMQARQVRQAAAAGALPRPVAEQQMGVIKERVAREIQLARTINGQIDGRAEQFEIASETLSPGTRGYVQTVRADRPRPVVLRRAAAVKLRPSEGSADLVQLRPRDRVTVTATRGNYALVETASGVKGYAPVSSLGVPPGRDPTAAPAGRGGGDVRSLAGSNAARRDAFAQSVAVTEQAAATSFELAS